MTVEHLVFDIETLGHREDAIVAALSCVPFSFDVKSSFEELVKKGLFIKFDVEEQIKSYGRSTSKEVLNWWSKQDKEVRDIILKPSENDMKLVEGLDVLEEYIKNTRYDWDASFVWSRGTYFDFPKIEHIHASTNKKLPFNLWKVRDVRTYIDILQGSIDGKYQLKNVEGKTYKHHCLYDAAYDAASLIEIYHDLASS